MVESRESQRGKKCMKMRIDLLSCVRQDVFLMIRRHKTTIFTDAKESTSVYELKRIVEGILKRPPEDQRLYKVNSPRQKTTFFYFLLLIQNGGVSHPTIAELISIQQSLFYCGDTFCIWLRYQVSGARVY